MRALARRIARVEAAGPATAPVPPIVIVGTGQSPRSACAAHAAAHPVRPRNHAPLLIPAKPTDAERQRFADRFKAQQMALVREARSERLALVFPAPDAALDGEPTIECAAIKRAREVVAASKVPPIKPTFAAANQISRSLRARINGRSPDNQ